MTDGLSQDLLRARYRVQRGGPVGDIYVARTDLAGPLDYRRAEQLAAQVFFMREDRQVGGPLKLGQVEMRLYENRTYLANGTRELRLSAGLGYCMMAALPGAAPDIAIAEGTVRLRGDMDMMHGGYQNVLGAMFWAVLEDYAPNGETAGLAGRQFSVPSPDPSGLAKRTMNNFGLQAETGGFAGDALEVYQAISAATKLKPIEL